jgi:hypothetical protein
MGPSPSGGLVAARPRRGPTSAVGFEPDPELDAPGDVGDLLLIEVKQGRAELNRGARNPAVLSAVLTRFGCCPEEHLPETVKALLDKGTATLPSGLRARLMAFGSVAGPSRGGTYRTVALAHVTRYLLGHLQQHWTRLRHAQIKDLAFGLLVSLEKARRGASPDERSDAVPPSPEEDVPSGKHDDGGSG